MQHIAEQIRPTDQTAGCVNDLVIENAVIVHGVGHERKYRNLAAIAGHERAEGQSVRGVRAAVGAGNGHITLVLRGEQVLHARHEIGEPADVLLQLRIGVVDHHRIKADARDNKERMAVIGGFIIGIAEALIKRYISSAMADAIVFALLIIVLLVKPSGLLGRNEREKV